MAAPRKQTQRETPMKPLGTDNEWNVDYAESVVNGIQQAGSRSEPFADPHLTTNQYVCDCGRVFLAQPSVRRRGRGRTCSRECAGRRAARAMHVAYSMVGALNFNWRGGRSARPYESHVKSFKLRNPEKVLAHRLIAAAVRTGRIRRPSSCSECHEPCRAQAHHDDYAKPLEVRWLCRACHRIADVARWRREPWSRGA